jgi:deoxyadenosine/deoxycytidine kinase
MKSINNNIIISIEGNIGSGKSSLIETLHLLKLDDKFKPIIFLKEPVDEWGEIVDENNNSILQLFYQSPEEYSFSFQMMAYISRLNNLKKALNENHNTIIITERSLYTDKYVFAQMLYDDNKIRKVDYSIYLKWFDSFINEIPIVHKVIYVNTDPKICLERIGIRLRTGEANISIEYLNNCHAYHNSLLSIYMKTIDVSDIYIYNGNIDKEAAYLKMNDLISFIFDFHDTI